MTYKNKDIHKEYERLWYLKKIGRFNGSILNEIRKKFNMKIPKLYDGKTKVERKRQAARVSYKKRKKRKKQIKDELGTECYICGKSNNRLITHRKDGKKHKDFQRYQIKDYEKELKSGKYVILCYGCHKGVHFCMDKLHLNWEQILRLASLKG